VLQPGSGSPASARVVGRPPGFLTLFTLFTSVTRVEAAAVGGATGNSSGLDINPSGATIVITTTTRWVTELTPTPERRWRLLGEPAQSHPQLAIRASRSTPIRRVSNTPLAGIVHAPGAPESLPTVPGAACIEWLPDRLRRRIPTVASGSACHTRGSVTKGKDSADVWWLDPCRK
jgi:hypothetical protein